MPHSSAYSSNGFDDSIFEATAEAEAFDIQGQGHNFLMLGSRPVLKYPVAALQSADPVMWKLCEFI